MGDIVNLNRFRKGRDRKARQQLVAVNRHKFARPKADLVRLDAELAKDAAAHEGHRLDDDGAATSPAEGHPAGRPRDTD